MIRLRHIAFWRVRAGPVAVLFLAAACARPADPAPPKHVSIWTSAPGGSYQQLGNVLVRIFTRLPDLAATVVTSGGSIDNVAALRTGAADVAVAVGDVVYQAHTEDTAARRLRRPSSWHLGAL